MSSIWILLYSLAIFGSECASEFVKNDFDSSSLILSAKNVSELKPSSIAGISLYFSLNILSNLVVQLP